MDREHIDYNLKELRKKKSNPFHLENEEVADLTFLQVQLEFPNAIMVKNGIHQYIIVSDRAKTTLLKQLLNSKTKHEKDIAEIDNVIKKLK